MAEGVGNAPTSARADPVFKTGAASLYLPAFQIGTRGRILTFIVGVRSTALCVLSYASVCWRMATMRTAANGCSGWNRTNTVPLNRRVDYCYPTEH